LLRRSPRPERAPGAPRPGDRLAFEDIAMDLRARTVTRDGDPLDLTRTEFALLEHLLRHPAKVLSRAQILKEVWGFDFEPASNTLDVYVMYLRRKLESHGGPRLIHTVRGLGYALRTA
jgi:two-component system response regulator MprA